MTGVIVPTVIVGNKSDLRPDQRQVSVGEGKALAEKFNCAYTEASFVEGFYINIL